MTNARIYKLAYENLLMKIDEEVERVVKAEKAGRPHRIADSRLARYYVEIEQLHEMLLQAEKGEI